VVLLSAKEGWKGIQNDLSTPSLAGNYVYKIIAKDRFDKIIEKIGIVALVK